ncbi:MAG: methyltransferase [Myxococcota bacterium]
MRFCYRTVEFGELDIHVRTLRNTNEFADESGEAEALGIPPASWPLFGVLWDSSIVLASMMVHRNITECRILEVGCGIGLASMVLNSRGADITATDRHPHAQAFLDHNSALNGESPIDFEMLDWANPDESLGQFDLIIASDLLYDLEQAEPLCRFIDAHALPVASVTLVDPGRGQAGAFGRHMGLRGFSHTRRHAKDDAALSFGREHGPRLQIHSFERG